VFAVGAIGPDATAAVPNLAAILTDDPEPFLRSEAGLALMKLAPASRAAVPALARALKDHDPLVRMYAVLTLHRLRGEARPAVPALIEALADDNNHARAGSFPSTIKERVAVALGVVSAGTADGVPGLRAALVTAVDGDLRVAACRGLGEVGPPARPAAPDLRALLRDKSAAVRSAAERALQAIGVAPDEKIDEPQGSTQAEVELKLPDSERSYLWKVENGGNLLVKHGFGPFAAALKAADTTALTRLMADDFTGAEPHDPRHVRSASGPAEVERWQDAGHPPAALTRDGFIRRLIAFRGVFPNSPPQVKLALMTLGPKVRGQLDGVWQGSAQLRLHGEYAKDAPAEVVVTLRYEVPRPTQDALGKPGWLRSASVVQVQTAKSPRYLFADVTRQRGLDPSRLTDSWNAKSVRPFFGGVFVCDFDRDGILDVLIVDRTASLYRGRVGGSFEDVTVRVGLPDIPLNRSWAAWADLDGDGWEDLLLGGRVYRNEDGRRLADRTAACDLPLPTDINNLVVADYDRDGRLDLYATRGTKPGSRSWLDGKSEDPRGNFLLRNLGGWRFADVTKASGTGAGRRSTFTAAWLDANDDGWPDLHVPNEFGDGVLLVNKGDGTFAEHPLADRPADFGTMGLAVGDVDNDGTIDVYAANMYSKAGTRVIGNMAAHAYPPDVMEKLRRFVAGSQLHLNRGGLKFDQAGKEKQVAAVGWAYGAALADLNNDGFLDVYATAGFVSRDRNEPDG
jgi:hypothetical protein